MDNVVINPPTFKGIPIKALLTMNAHERNVDLVNYINALSGVLSYRCMCYKRAVNKARITKPANQNEFSAF